LRAKRRANKLMRVRDRELIITLQSWLESSRLSAMINAQQSAGTV